MHTRVGIYIDMNGVLYSQIIYINLKKGDKNCS